MNAYICVCGHNRPDHAMYWNGFQGVWETSCNHTEWGVSGRGRCPCPAFNPGEAS